MCPCMSKPGKQDNTEVLSVEFLEPHLRNVLPEICIKRQVGCLCTIKAACGVIAAFELSCAAERRFSQKKKKRFQRKLNNIYTL